MSGPDVTVTLTTEERHLITNLLIAERAECERISAAIADIDYADMAFEQKRSALASRVLDKLDTAYGTAVTA